jgi:alkanesulfonate monooxygenase SsuD/methylene tetrahydromethanopterin reductase-like flavin-dependent oxidoreductase (luciferase family)
VSGLETFRKAHKDASKSGRVLLHFPLCIGRTDTEAREHAGTAFRRYLQMVSSYRAGGNPNVPKPQTGGAAQTCPEGPLFGSAKEIRRRLCEWRDMGVTDFSFMTRFGSLPLARARETLTRFTEEVMTYVQDGRD